MRVTVVDASAIAAVLFDEPESPPVVAAVRGEMLAPELVRYELANICATKLRRHPEAAELTLARYRLLAEFRLTTDAPDWANLPMLAMQWNLSGYDAAYLDLALRNHAPLVTLDARLARAWTKASAK